MPRSDAAEDDRIDRSVQTGSQDKPGNPEAGTASEAREDDRNEEIPESPAPDPEEVAQPGAEDDPGAD